MLLSTPNLISKDKTLPIVSKVIVKKSLFKEKTKPQFSIDSIKLYPVHNTNFNNKSTINPSQHNYNHPTTSSPLIIGYSPSRVSFQWSNSHPKVTNKNIQIIPKYKIRNPKLNPFLKLINTQIMTVLNNHSKSQMTFLSHLLSDTRISSPIAAFRNRGNIKFDDVMKSENHL